MPLFSPAAPPPGGLLSTPALLPLLPMPPPRPRKLLPPLNSLSMMPRMVERRPPPLLLLMGALPRLAWGELKTAACGGDTPPDLCEGNGGGQGFGSTGHDRNEGWWGCLTDGPKRPPPPPCW